MKKILAISLVASLGFGIAAISPVYSTTTTTTTTTERGSIAVNTTTNTEIAPDTVDISIAIKTKDAKSLQKAADENKQISDKIYTELKTMINNQNGDYIKTANYNARPVYVYNSSNKKVLDKYEVSNSIIVHTKNIDKSGAIIDKALGLGATDINDLRFSVSNYDAKCNSLLEDAAKRAKTRVDIIAKASGTYVTGVKNITMNCSDNSVNVVPYRLMTNKMMSAGAASDSVAETASTPIQSGSVKIYATLNAEYFVK